MTKAITKLGEWLGRTPAGRDLLAADRAEGARLEERRALRARLDAAKARELDLPDLEAEVRDAEAKLTEATERLGAQAQQARRAYREAAHTSSHQRTVAQNLLRRSAPHAVAEDGPLLATLQKGLEHVRSHMLLKPAEHSERLGDFARAGKPAKDRESYARIARELEFHAWSETCAETITTAMERVREAQLDVEPDIPALVAELIDDTLVERCICGADFGWTDSFATPQLSVA